MGGSTVLCSYVSSCIVCSSTEQFHTEVEVEEGEEEDGAMEPGALVLPSLYPSESTL